MKRDAAIPDQPTGMKAQAEQASLRAALQLAHPLGEARFVRIVHGARVRGAPTGADAAPEAPDLLIAEFSSRKGAEREQAVFLREVEAVLAAGGVAFVVVSRALRGRMYRHLTTFRHARVEIMAQLPSNEEMRYLVPVAMKPFRFALSQAASLHPAVRAVGNRLVGLPGASLILKWLLPAVGFLVFRKGVLPWGWLRRNVTGAVDGVVTNIGWRGPQSGIVLHVFGPASDAPVFIAKVPGEGVSAHKYLREVENLGQLGPSAARAGARVPTVIAVFQQDGRSVVVEDSLRGSPAAAVIRGRPARARDLLERLATWVAHWHRETVNDQLFDLDCYNRLIGTAINDLEAELAVDYYREVRDRAGMLADTRIPLVAAHNDLTTRNMLLDSSESPGVVDWEVAEAADFPLMDYFYAAADVAWVATGGSRLSAFRACFQRSGDFFQLVSTSIMRIANSLGLDRILIDLAFDACWIRHARNEASAAFEGNAKPFGEILFWLAANRREVDVMPLQPEEGERTSLRPINDGSNLSG